MPRPGCLRKYGVRQARVPISLQDTPKMGTATSPVPQAAVEASEAAATIEAFEVVPATEGDVIEAAIPSEVEAEEFDLVEFDASSTTSSSTDINSSIYQHSYENGRRVCILLPPILGDTPCSLSWKVLLIECP